MKKKLLVGWVIKNWEKWFDLLEFVEILKSLKDVGRLCKKDYKKVRITIEVIK